MIVRAAVAHVIPRLDAHDRLEAEDARAGSQNDDGSGQDLSDDVIRKPSAPMTVADRHDRQEGLPAYVRARDRRRHAVAVEAEGRARQHEVSAEPRLPAIAVNPQTRKDRVAHEGHDDGLGEGKASRTHDPHEIRTEIFAANHGMNRSRRVSLAIGFWNDLSRPAVRRPARPMTAVRSRCAPYVTEYCQERRNPITQVTFVLGRRDSSTPQSPQSRSPRGRPHPRARGAGHPSRDVAGQQRHLVDT